MLEDLRFQFTKLPYPVADCTGKTIVVVGSNIGMGKEAVRHFARLNASKVIIAVRSISKGEEAKADIESTTKRTGILEVWELDLARYASVQAFAARLADLPRVDAVVANASIATHKFELFEGSESQITNSQCHQHFSTHLVSTADIAKVCCEMEHYACHHSR